MSISQCPICKKPVEEPDERTRAEGERSYYPFCSERCKLIDLGRWLGGKYQIPVVRDDEAHDGGRGDDDDDGDDDDQASPPPRPVSPT